MPAGWSSMRADADLLTPRLSACADTLKYYGFELGAMTSYDKKVGKSCNHSKGMSLPEHEICSGSSSQASSALAACSPPRAERQQHRQRRSRGGPPLRAAGKFHQEVGWPWARAMHGIRSSICSF